MFDFNGDSGGGAGINLAGRGGGRNRTRGAAAQESRSDFVKRQHKEREAREKKRTRERAATLIQAVFRSHLCLRELRHGWRQTFDKKHSDLSRAAGLLPPDRKARFVYLALLPMIRFFVFFFQPAEDGMRLANLLELVLYSCEQLEQQDGRNLLRLALADDGARLSFLVLLEKLVRATLRMGRTLEFSRLLVSMQAVLFGPAPDHIPVDASKSAAAVCFLLVRTDAMVVLTSQVLPVALLDEQAASRQSAEQLVLLLCAALEVCDSTARSKFLVVLLSTPRLGRFLCQEMPVASGRLEELLRNSEVLPLGGEALLDEELYGMTRRAWLLSNLVDVIEHMTALGDAGGRSQPWSVAWLPWAGQARASAAAGLKKGSGDARLVAEIERVNQASFVRSLLRAIDRQPPRALLFACQLWFTGLGVDAAASPGEPAEPPPEVLQTLAFATPLAERLYPTLAPLLRESSMESVFQALGPPAFSTREATQLRIFCAVYTLQLQPMYDFEFFGPANALRLEEVEALIPFLNRLAYHFVTAWPDRSTLAPAAKALRSGLTMLLGALYNRHRRKPILRDPSAWIILESKLLLRRAPVVDLGGDDSPKDTGDAMDDEEDANMDVEGAATTGASASKASHPSDAAQALEAVLEEIPHVLPFEERVTLLHNVVTADQERRRDTRGPWAMMSRQHRIRRNFLVEDGYAAFEGLVDESQLRDVFRVEFIAPDGSPESGVDGGGLFKEFMVHTCRHMFDPEFGLFTATEDQTLYPSTSAYLVHPQASDLYVFLGKVVGKAIYEMCLLESQFSRVFLNRLLGRINEVDDIAALDKELHRNMIKIKETECVEDLDLTFSVSVAHCGHHEEVDLIKDGRNVRVTRENLTRYLHLMANYKTNVQFERAKTSFLRGLQCVLPLAWLKMFDPYELNMLISGSSTGFDVRDLERNTVYSGGYNENNPTIQWLWELLRNHMEPDDMARFLMFSTSCSRAPLLGFKTLHPKFCLHRVPDGSRLPTASTCANLLKLPEYTSFEALKTKVLQAIRSGAGFDFS